MNTRNFNTNTSNNDEWLTPPKIVEVLGPFDLDPCSPVKRPWSTADKHYTVKDGGLEQEWLGRVWLNPPYGRETFKWLERLSYHPNGGVALIFARTETIGFHEQIWKKAHSVFFFKGRLKFFKVSGEEGDCANAPSCLVSYTEGDTHTIQAATEHPDPTRRLRGRLVLLQPTIDRGGLSG